jgi:hypothetical protein
MKEIATEKLNIDWPPTLHKKQAVDEGYSKRKDRPNRRRLLLQMNYFCALLPWQRFLVLPLRIGYFLSYWYSLYSMECIP